MAATNLSIREGKQFGWTVDAPEIESRETDCESGVLATALHS